MIVTEYKRKWWLQVLSLISTKKCLTLERHTTTAEVDKWVIESTNWKLSLSLNSAKKLMTTIFWPGYAFGDIVWRNQQPFNLLSIECLQITLLHLYSWYRSCWLCSSTGGLKMFSPIRVTRILLLNVHRNFPCQWHNTSLPLNHTVHKADISCCVRNSSDTFLNLCTATVFLINCMRDFLSYCNE